MSKSTRMDGREARPAREGGSKLKRRKRAKRGPVQLPLQGPRRPGEWITRGPMAKARDARFSGLPQAT